MATIASKASTLHTGLSFEFAFDNPNFSDRVLRLVIGKNSAEVPSDTRGPLPLEREGSQQHKGKDGDGPQIAGKGEEASNASQADGSDLRARAFKALWRMDTGTLQKFIEGATEEAQKRTEDIATFKRHDDGPAATLPKNEARKSMDAPEPAGEYSFETVETQVEHVHVCRAVLAAHSEVFCAMFSHNMQESSASVVEIPLDAFEKEPFMNLLKAIYDYPGAIKDSADSLKLLVMADKYRAKAVVQKCVKVLLSDKPTVHIAAKVCSLPESIRREPSVQKLDEKMMGYLEEGFDKFKNTTDAMKFPLELVERLLGSDNLHTYCEDMVLQYALAWTEASEMSHATRVEVFSNKFSRLIRFRFATTNALLSLLSFWYVDLETRACLTDFLQKRLDASNYPLAMKKDITSRFGQVMMQHGTAVA